VRVLYSLFIPGLVAVSATATAGSLVGHVRTSDDVALAGVALTVRGPSGEERLTTTGPDGSYRVPDLDEATYSVAVDAPGLIRRDPSTVHVTGGESRLDVVLVPAPVSERVLVSATRGEAPLSAVGVSAAVLDRQRIQDRHAPSLLPLLQEVPGVATARSGQVGQQGSAFIRGGESRFARVIVDGVPVNQPGGAFDFGTVLPFELDRIEIVRGAASSLYGTDALAGVVSLETRRADRDETPSLRAEGEAGTFDWQRWQGSTSGTRGPVDWNAGVQRLRTDNQAPGSAFEQTAFAFSGGLVLGARTEARVVARVDDGTVGTPGPTGFGSRDLDASFERRDLAVSTLLRHSDTRASHQVSVGYARTNQLSLDPLDSGCYVPAWEGREAAWASCDFPSPEGFLNLTDRLAVGYQAEAAVGTRHLLTTGAELEHETGQLGDRAGDLLRPERTNYGAYLQDRVVLGAHAYLTVGGRIETNGSYGTRAVPRAALAVRLREGEDATTLRASAGMGIKEPSFFESYGESFFAKGNPDLDPERSTTFDLGIDQRLLSSRVRVAATFFHHDYRDQIAYSLVDPATFEGTYVNLARTRARGVELELEARPTNELHLYGQYTFLDGEILESPSGFDPVYAEGQALLRRPRHAGSLTARLSFPRWSTAVTLTRVGERADSDFVGIGLTTNPAYTRLDARARVIVTGPIEAFVVADNLTDERYQEALGFPALGRAVRGGLRLTLGGGRR